MVMRRMMIRIMRRRMMRRRMRIEDCDDFGRVSLHWF